MRTPIPAGKEVPARRCCPERRKVGEHVRYGQCVDGLKRKVTYFKCSNCGARFKTYWDESREVVVRDMFLSSRF